MQIYTNMTGYNSIKDTYSLNSMSATRQTVICESYIIPKFESEAVWLNFVNHIQNNYSEIGSIATLWLMPMCIDWQVKSIPLLPTPPNNLLKTKSNGPKVLIIGNINDPMTPFKNAIAVKSYLNKFNIQAKLVVWNGVSHTALLADSPLSSCVFHHVDQFLQGKYLPNVVRCNDWKNPFLS